MRAKYAKQIRAGVKRAQFEVRFTQDFGHPPISLYYSQTPLERRAYDRTLAKMVASHILSIGKRLLEKVDQFIEAQEGAMQIGPQTKAAIEEYGMPEVEVSFLGGPYNGLKRTLRRTPPVVEIGASRYSLITDPETGRSLKAYAYEANS